MKILLNTTKTMDLQAPVPKGTRTTAPLFADEAASLASALGKLSRPRLKTLMGLSEKLADETRAGLARWGEPDNPARPALFAFTGLVYKHLDAPGLDATDLKKAQTSVYILSGLYGLLRPLDRIEAYRLEMGVKWKPPGAKTLVEFWKPRLTEALNDLLKTGEPVISVCAQEYMKAVDLKSLGGPVISPVFKIRRHDGSLKTAPVHAKMARGALVRYALQSGAKKPADLLGFGELGWEAAEEPPDQGNWLFTRPETG